MTEISDLELLLVGLQAHVERAAAEIRDTQTTTERRRQLVAELSDLHAALVVFARSTS